MRRSPWRAEAGVCQIGQVLVLCKYWGFTTSYPIYRTRAYARSPLLFSHCQAASLKLMPRLRPSGRFTCWNETSGDFFSPHRRQQSMEAIWRVVNSPSARLKSSFFSLHSFDLERSRIPRTKRVVCCVGLNQDLSLVHRHNFFEYISKITWLQLI